METILGRKSLALDLTGLAERLANYNRVMLDLGTGDGRYVQYLADNFPDAFVIGVDACRENLQEHSRTKQPNALFVIANAQDLPHELNGLVSHLTINFPWGSLLKSLLDGDPKFMHGLEAVSCMGASLTVRLNGGALAEQAWTLEDGAEQIYNNLMQAGWQLKDPVLMQAEALRGFPTTWAKRLAFGRDPRAMQLSGYL
jgi:16S rRNA (adenine(1408)-N(1))-methyltransferase